jgi:Tfp pilus assembly protein PilZ
MSQASAVPQTTAPKAQARVALIGLAPNVVTILHEGFKQFSIQTVVLDQASAEEQINKQKFEACVVVLDDGAAAVLSAVRKSKSNNRMVVYGICATAQEALKYSQFGINAIFNSPVDRSGALKVIRGTHLLVVHELRRYVRIPMMCPLELKYEYQTYRGGLHEISGGGMSLETTVQFTIGQNVEVTFQLPGIEMLALRAVVAWVRRDQRLIGLRFDASEPNRFRVKNWIDQYLDIS